MVIAKTLIKNETEHGNGDPAEIFANVNARLIEVNKAYMFVTAWLGILDISTGTVRYVNAGHECPAICRAGGKFEVMKDSHDAPLAARKKTKFSDRIFTLDPKDTLYVYTDGVTDARSPENEMFGRDRMPDALNRETDAHPETIDRNIRDSIDSFVKDADQFDDTTMLCLKYLGAVRD
jgi:sigma-B regulation protein RsbU (phosphoserine phosphatase)